MNVAESQNELRNTLAETFKSLQLETYGRERVYFGLGDYQGKRLLIQIPVYFSEIPNLVPAADRTLIVSRIEKIKDYILHRVKSSRAWILGSLTVNVNPADIQLSSLGSNLYIVRIPNCTLLHTTDGQHRIQAIRELMGVDEHRRLVSNEQIPLTLILDSDIKQAAVDFRDMQQQIALAPALLVGFSSEGRDGIARAIVSKVPLFHYTEIAKATPGTGSKNIYTINYIAGLVGCAISSNPNAELLEYDTQELVEEESDKLSNWLNRFFSCCPYTAPLVANFELTAADVASFRSSSILGISVGLEILGHLIHRSSATPEQLATQIDWSRTSTIWRDLIVTRNAEPGKHKVKAASAASASQVADQAISLLKTKAYNESM